MRQPRNRLISLSPYLLISLLLLPFTFHLSPSHAQSPTTALEGRVRDAETNEPMPFVQIVFEGTTVGTETDMDGRFSISNNQGYTTVVFRMMGYESQKMKLQRGKKQKRATVKMVPRGKTLQSVEISAKKSKKKYSRRHNPAVELVKKVIDHKEQNRIEALDRWHRDVYERLSMSLDDFNPDFEGKRLWRKLNFLEKYIDETEFDATPILIVSIRELLAEESYRRQPKQQRRLVKGKRMEGLDEILSDEGIDENIRAMFNPVDIYDGDIELMLNHFTSPLSPLLATSFYKFYITDTTLVDGQRCVELSFVPANKQSYGFNGRMYVSLDPDSSFALTKYVMSVSPHVNLNFVRDLSIVQTFHRDSSGHYLPYRCDTYGRMYISKHIQELYVHQTRVYTRYALGDTASLLPDSLFSSFEHEVTLPRKQLLHSRRQFNARRPIPLTTKETVLDSMWIELGRLPEFRALKYTGELLTSAYIPTSASRKASKVDLGPIFNFLSFNHQEGWRLRFGGMTKAQLSPRHFLEGYAAFGFRDRRPKGSLTYTYTFDDKERHSHEPPFSSLSLKGSYELVAPGQNYDNFDRDNILSSSDKPMNLQYVAQAQLRLRKEWKSHLRFDTWLALSRTEPAGTLRYLQYQTDGSLQPVNYFSDAEWHLGLSFVPNFSPGTRRRETQSNLRNDALSLSLEHTLSLPLNYSATQPLKIRNEKSEMRNQKCASLFLLSPFPFLIHSTSFSAQKRIWLSSFGHIDTRLIAGAIWNRAPYPRLYIPSGNSNLFLSSTAFNSMQPMEFIMDRYAALFATYHLKGWILNRIPLINRLRLREVLGFNILYGTLTSRNNPAVGDPTGLYLFPAGTRPIGDVPYMEYSVGIENILKFLRVDFVRRLTYTDGVAPRDRWFIRLDLKFSL